MEKNSLSNNLKHHSIGGRSMKENSNSNNKNRVKDSWEGCKSDSHGGGDFLSGLSWSPRSYTCSFCKREFKSAQALGGHMNVHRRDRARLRQSPPPRDGQYPFLNLNLTPNPNPNPNQNPNNPFSSQSSSSPSTRFPPFTSTPSLSSLSSPSFVSASEITKRCLGNRTTDFTKIKSSETIFGAQVSECEVLKRAEIVTLDLEIGLLSDSKEDLDLELRLGCS